MVAPTCFGITLPSSGSVPSALWEMLNWGAVDRILWMGVLCLVTWSPEQVTPYCDGDGFTLTCEEVRVVRETQGGRSQQENSTGCFCDGFSLDVISLSCALQSLLLSVRGKVDHENLYFSHHLCIWFLVIIHTRSRECSSASGSYVVRIFKGFIVLW
jgi:hypothetical protein